MTDTDTRLRAVGLALLFIFVAIATYLALPGTALAGPAIELADPIVAPTDAYADLIAAKRSGGWALALLAGLVMLSRVAARIPGSIGEWLRTGPRATIVAAVAAISVAAFDALALGGGWGAVLFAAVGAGFALLAPVPTPRQRPLEAGHARLAVMLGLIAAGGLVMSCAARQRAASGVGTVLDCEAPALREAVAELIPLGIEALRGLIAVGETDVGRAQLLETLRPIRSAAGRCAVAGAIAALAEPMARSTGLAAAGPGPVERFAAARAELGWPEIRLAGGATL